MWTRRKERKKLWKEEQLKAVDQCPLPSRIASGYNPNQKYLLLHCSMGFPDSSVGKESTWNVGDPSSIPGLGRSTGEGIGYPLQYSWASLVAQLVKNLPEMWETWVISLGWEDPLEKGMATYSSMLAWRIPWTEEPGGLQSMGSQRVRYDWASSLHFNS